MYVEKSGDKYSIITHVEGKPFYIKHYSMIDGKLKLETAVKHQFVSLADAKKQINKGQ